jgi:hypothetical protein
VIVIGDQLEEWSAMQNVDANGWREADYDRLLAEGEAGGFAPIMLGTVIGAESEFRTDIPNKEGSGAEGLTQMMPDVLLSLGWKPGLPAYDAAGGDFSRAPVSVQLDFAYKYFAYWRRRFGLAKWASRAQMYLANFLPADLPHGKDEGFILAGQGRRTKVYEQNWRALDRNRDGKILVAEVELFLVDAISRRAKSPFTVFLEGVQRARRRRGLLEVEYHNDHADTGLQDVGDVRQVQAALTRHGFDPGPVDGIPGPKTTAAVRAFQASRGLVVDGLVGVASWSALARPALPAVA